MKLGLGGVQRPRGRQAHPGAGGGLGARGRDAAGGRHARPTARSAARRWSERDGPSWRSSRATSPTSGSGPSARSAATCASRTRTPTRPPGCWSRTRGSSWGAPMHAARWRRATSCCGPWETALEPGELLIAIEVPPVPAGAAMTHLRFATHERPTATVSCLARVADGVVAEARVAVGSVGRATRPGTRCGGADGRPRRRCDRTQPRIDAAGEAAAAASEPDTDSNGSAEYKADLVRVLTGRALQRAIGTARGSAV